MVEFQPVILQDPDSTLRATYVPQAGMICTSLSDDGTEFLGRRRGLDAYVSAAKTMGVPILYPWANRLGANTYTAEGATVTVTPGVGGVHPDEHGWPIHGVLAGNSGWLVDEKTENTLVASLDWSSQPDLLAVFPFPHTLTMAIALADRTLMVTTTVTPTTAATVPLSYGYHPYFTIPGVPRPEWQIETPSMRRLAVDDRAIPTGDTSPWAGGTETLGDTFLDHGFDQVAAGAVFSVSGGNRRITVTFVSGYGSAQIFAPLNDEVICFEPMTAPTDALRRGTYPVAVPGKPETSVFSITVS
ncbi:aldose epimerase [Mycobacterium sp. SWH-M5]|nr:aldose epimerase [Mycobacterium sp. SWH-M5]